MIEHHIQRTILRLLTRNESLRFSELRPEGMENNAFMYHLSQLVRAKYVEKHVDAYRLTVEGQIYASTLSEASERPRQQPKLTCAMFITNSDGLTLLAKRKEHPLIGVWMLPGGKQHYGESPEEHVKRESNEMVGPDLKFVRSGTADIRIRHGADIVIHQIINIFISTDVFELPAETARFRYEWRDVTQMNDAELMPGTRQILRAIEATNGNFLLSLDEYVD